MIIIIFCGISIPGHFVFSCVTSKFITGNLETLEHENFTKVYSVVRWIYIYQIFSYLGMLVYQSPFQSVELFFCHFKKSYLWQMFFIVSNLKQAVLFVKVAVLEVFRSWLDSHFRK